MSYLYVTQPGDTFYTIAQRHNITLLDLYRANLHLMSPDQTAMPENFPTHIRIPDTASQDGILLIPYDQL